MQKEKLYKYILFFILTAGIVLRLYLYLKNQTLWYDEAALAENILSKSYFELFKGLDFMQAAPALFTIMIKAFYEVLNPQTAESRDLVLRFIPFVSGILVIPAFYYLSKLVFDNKKLVLISTAFFTFTPCAILYSAQLKQYSTELFLAVVLLIIFYKMSVQNIFKGFYAIIIAICPWLSYSSFFIIGAGFVSVLLKNWKKCLLYFIPFVLSCIIYYFLSLKSVFCVNYSGMDDFWSQGYAFIKLNHPLRLLIRIGELYVIEKPLAIITGGVFVFAIIRLKKLLFVLPVVFALIASSLHKYPFIARLILFLLPVFIIALVSLKGKIGTISKIIITLIMGFFFVNFNYFYEIITYSYSREAVQYLAKNIKSDDIMIMDTSFSDYDFYLRDYNIKNKIIRTPEICAEKTLDSCVDFIRKLPAGKYYFLSSSVWVNEIMRDSGVAVQDIDLGFEPKKEKAVYFEKFNY